jgi:transcriptional regulator with XRE-family HTH domain
MQENNKGFDAESFYKALSSTVNVRKVNWKQVSIETGVSTSTLSRMATGRQPDAGSLAALSTWAGLDLSEFVEGARRPAEPIAMVGKLLREDPNLNKDGAEALEAILLAAYDRFRLNGNQK